MRKIMWGFPLLCLATYGALAQADACRNPNRKTYNSAPRFCAPEGTRAEGISIRIDGALKSVPDARCGCLPIALRYNNPGNLKTPAAGPWKGQIGKDDKGHALFSTVGDGVAAWNEWLKRRYERDRLRTATQFISLYAPPGDRVGSIGVPPNCPHGPNPTRAYAEKVAAAAGDGRGPDDPLDIDGSSCAGRKTLAALFAQIATLEIGADFCKGPCLVDSTLFASAADAVWGPVAGASCAGG